ncbi:MAG: hypothetical protein FJ135_13335 [Deltaproteobacteria bacterium]|nr:hypothetical protein [Deltaproteobacteria bacterium]
MNKERLVCLMISISKHHRDLLRRMAAEENLQNPDKVTSAAVIAREMVIKQLEALKQGRTMDS